MVGGGVRIAVGLTTVIKDTLEGNMTKRNEATAYKCIRNAVIATAVGLGLAYASTAAFAATVTMQQNQWAVFEADRTFNISPISKDGSFSYSYGFSDTGCGNSGAWSCAPTDLKLGEVQTSFSHNFGYGWSPVNVHGQREDSLLPVSKLLMFFRVNSGSGSVSWADVAETPAPVPLPAAGLLLVAALGALGLVKGRGA